MYRRLLAASDDGSVTVISLGFATTLADLLSSGGDAISPLTGRELVARKVASLSIMAGSFPTATKPARAEFNIVNDIDAAVQLFDQWPTPIVCAPFELGRQVQFPGRIMAEGLDWAEHHPVVDGYRAYRPMPYDRAAWDLMSVLWVTAGEGLFTVSAGTSVCRLGGVYALRAVRRGNAPLSDGDRRSGRGSRTTHRGDIYRRAAGGQIR